MCRLPSPFALPPLLLLVALAPPASDPARAADPVAPPSPAASAPAPRPAPLAPAPPTLTLVIEPGLPGAAPLLRLPGLAPGAATAPTPPRPGAHLPTALGGLALAAAAGWAGLRLARRGQGVNWRGNWVLGPAAALAGAAVIGASGCPPYRTPYPAYRRPHTAALQQPGTLAGEVLLEPGRAGHAWLVLDRDALEALGRSAEGGKP